VKIAALSGILYLLNPKQFSDVTRNSQLTEESEMNVEKLAGTNLGDYEIESLLGRGGMGGVYKAHQLSLERPVALKILLPALSSDSSFVKRFKREARAVAKLSHPNITQIYAIAEEQDLHFFSMEYIEGKTLDKVLEEKGKLEPNEAAQIISQTARALEHAHRNNIIHRDIKPSNIILDSLSTVKVMDFGLARATDDRSKVTQAGTLIGTLSYMSPEQCRGEELDFQTDIYSLGIVLYEMLTGRPPFDAPNEVAMIHKIISQKPPEAKEVNRSLPNELSAIVSRAISKDRDDRHAGISELIEDIRDFQSSQSSVVVAREKSSPSIAVLPFVNMSADPDQEYFCDGLSEELINGLSQIEDLKVIARTSAFSFKNKALDIQEIGRKLRVKTILEGSLRKSGTRLRITAQLVDTTHGHQIWSERYDRELDDIFAIQDEITEAIILKLKPWLVGEEKARLAKQRQTVDVEVYNLYLRGRHFWNRRSEEGINRAIECFTEAIDKAPTYAPPYTGLADCHILSAWYEFLSSREAFPKARIVALKAMEINDLLAEAHTSLAQINLFFDWNWEDAEKRFKRAIALNSGYATAHEWYAVYLLIVGRSDEAIAEIEQALELDPFSIGINVINGVILLNTRHYDLAIEALKKTIELDPSYAYAHNFLGAAYFGKGIYEEALTAYEKAEKLPQGRVRAKAGIATVRASTGRMDEARSILTELLELRKKRYVRPIYLAYVYLALGEPDQCFKWLNKAYEERDEFLSLINSDPILEALDIRSDPRYIELLKKMNLDK